MKKYFVICLILLTQIAISGCSKNWSDPADSIASRKISIANLLANRAAFDSAGISITGKVWDLRQVTEAETEDDPEITYMAFTLADRKGIGINVYAEGVAPVTDGSFVRVTGIYRKIYQREEDIYADRVVAVRIEDWKPGITYWIREFEFD